MHQKALTAKNSSKAITLLEDNKHIWYNEYIEALKEQCRLPKKHLKKRRFNIPLTTLSNNGVIISKMLDKQLLYTPVINDFTRSDCYDKLNDRVINSSDGLNLIKPLTDEEIINRAKN